MTPDSIYQTVARACYEKTGKRTNPHLIRDMIVTHVSETDASEKELEALALYTGHSIQMQRTSYDRRTLNQKVAPAVSLLQSLSKPKELLNSSVKKKNERTSQLVQLKSKSVIDSFYSTIYKCEYQYVT